MVKKWRVVAIRQVASTWQGEEAENQKHGKAGEMKLGRIGGIDIPMLRYCMETISAEGHPLVSVEDCRQI